MQRQQNIYFLGIGGIGMSALAYYFLQHGDAVYGYDHVPSTITQNLQNAGAHIHFDENIQQIPPQVDFVIYTPAIHKEHKEFQYFLQHNIPIYKRSQILGKLAQGHSTIAVAGTHGKTTTTAILTQLFMTYRPIMSFIGGIAKNFNNNFYIDPQFDTVIAEADEFDRSFLTLFPTIAVITSLDADHLDIYHDRSTLIESFQLFANQIDKNGTLLIHEKISHLIQHPHKLVYGEGEHCDFRISDICLNTTTSTFTLHSRYGGYWERLVLGVSGHHNVLNAAAATAVGQLLHLTEEQCRGRLAEFCGVKRRFDYQIDTKDMVFIDDYAHHPEEIRAILTTVKKLYHKKLTVIFQPHLYTRTRDFAPQFAEVLALADRVILLDIYPARELPIPGITSQFLLDLIPLKDKVLVKKEELLNYLEQNRPEVLLTIGAGDIDKLVPIIKEKFSPLQ